MSGHASTLSAGAIVIIALAALVILACAAWALARWLAFEPSWARTLGQTIGEARFRLSATWAEFADWIRLGH